MALRSAWWWPQPVPMRHVHPPTPAAQAQQAYQSWPQSQAVNGIIFGNLEKKLRETPGSNCTVHQYAFISTATISPARPKWTFQKTAHNVVDLVDLLVQPFPRDVHSIVYITTFLQAESIQALGYHLAITPRFFNFPYAQLFTGNLVEQYVFYSLQFMDKYRLGFKPYEASRSGTSPSYQFRSTTDDYNKHIWHVTCIRLIFLRSSDAKQFRGVIEVDPLDDAISEGLKTLMTREEEIPPGDAEKYAGLGQVLSETMYIVTFTWIAFFNEADAHLQILSRKCVDESLSPTEQLQFTRELHQLSPLWGQVRRRLIAAKDLAGHLIEHPFFASIGGHNGRVAIEGYLNKQINVLDDQISRCSELADQTNVLISLIFNIATLQDTRAAVEESKAANTLANSIRRVTMLTFIYLPFTLSSSVLGMNITQITGERAHSPLWAYFTIAVGLMILMFGGWYLWSRIVSTMDRRSRAKASSPTA